MRYFGDPPFPFRVLSFPEIGDFLKSGKLYPGDRGFLKTGDLYSWGLGIFGKKWEFLSRGLADL